MYQLRLEEQTSALSMPFSMPGCSTMSLSTFAAPVRSTLSVDKSPDVSLNNATQPGECDIPTQMGSLIQGQEISLQFMLLRLVRDVNRQ